MTFARKPYTRPARAPLVPRSEPARATLRSKPALVAVPKSIILRSESYRCWVATLPCIVCRIEGYSQAAHPNFGRGLGQKASDLDCFPLCCTRPGHMGHHAEHDLLIEMTRDERRELERGYIARTHATARAAGRTEIA